MVINCNDRGETRNMNKQTQNIVITGLLAAIVFVGTYMFKIPFPFGYTHLGDCIIVFSVCMFGTRKAALAGAIGAGFADLLGGYAVWVVPTMIFKAIWAIIMGIIAYKVLPKYKYGWVVGAIVGGLVHSALYTLIKIPLYGMEMAMIELPIVSAQSAVAIVFGGVIYIVASQSKAFTKFAQRA